ncbi:MAG: ester cyclase [Chloroflexota bacterium]|nr:MAG: ester cyclase [Chloroflexota bacterium]
MLAEINRTTFRHLVDEVMNNRNYDLMVETVNPDSVEREAITGIDPGREGTRQVLQAIRAAFPDLHVAIEDLLADGDKIAAWSHWIGTHR